MAEHNINNHLFDEGDEIIQNLDYKTELRFSRKDHPEGKMVSLCIDEREEFILIPLDIKDGDTIKICGKGKRNSRTGRTGDLYVLVHIEEKTIPWNKLWIPVLLLATVIAASIILLKTIAEPEKTAEPAIASCSHQWVEATCTTPRTCKICGTVSGILSGHQWNEATYNEPTKCTICGATEGSMKTPSAPLGLRKIISSTSASSVYGGDKLGQHIPENMYDGKLNTNWTEDASGSGISESVTFFFDDTYAVNKLHIYSGSHFNKTYYDQNCRPKAIALTFSDGSIVHIQLEDTYDEQIITFDQYYYTNYIKLTIEDVYTGTKYLDTVIAELDFVAYTP